jgi:hypothetical protein
MLYIDLRKLIYSILGEMQKELENKIDKEELKMLQSKYQASNTLELIEILICKTSRNCINLNYKDFIDEINTELSQLHFDNQLLTNKNTQLEFDNKKLIEKYEEIKELQLSFKKNEYELMKIVEKFGLDKQKNKIDFNGLGL